MELTVVVANLDRRHDRWYTCLGALIALGYSHKLRRFSSHDWQMYKNFERARDAASASFPNSCYICNNVLGVGYFCWSWTWYEIMHNIANGEYGDLVLLLVDDYAPRVRYVKMRHILKILEREHPIKCVQLSHNSQTAPSYKHDDRLLPGRKIPGTQCRQGIHESGDAANILSPSGAQEILEIADRHENAGVPNWQFYKIPRELDDTRGYYCSSNYYTYLGSRFISKFEDGR